MAQNRFVPKINLPIEGVEHARWLEKRALEQETFNQEVRRFMARSGKGVSAGARQTTVINNRGNDTAAAVRELDGLPTGGTTGQTVRKSSFAPGLARWTFENQGLLPEYWVTLSASGGSYFVSGMGLSGVESADEELSAALLPPVLFDDGGLTMLPLSNATFPDAILGAFSWEGQSPIALYVDVTPAFDGEEFTIHLPYCDNLLGVTTPYYTFYLNNPTGFDAVVNIQQTALYYAGTNIPVQGDVAVWDVPSGFSGAWHVLHVKGFAAAAIPMRLDETVSSDAYYDANVASMARTFQFPDVVGTVTTSTGAARRYNHTVGLLNIGKVTADVGTAPTGSAITLVVKKNGVSITTSFSIAAGSHTGTAVLSDTSMAPGDYLTVDVTAVGSTIAGSDLTVQVWAG